MTEALKHAIRASGKSLYLISKDTGVNEDSIARFYRGDQSLRLDRADVLAEYLGLEITIKPKEGK